MRKTIAATLTAALLLAACGGGDDTASDATTTTGGDRSTTTTAATGSGGATAGAPDKAKFCEAANFFTQDPPDQRNPDTLASFGTQVTGATDTMIATAPDRSIVPALEAQKKSFELFVAASTGPQDDAAAVQQKFAEADALFPKELQDQVSGYVKSECGIDLNE